MTLRSAEAPSQGSTSFATPQPVGDLATRDELLWRTLEAKEWTGRATLGGPRSSERIAIGRERRVHGARYSVVPLKRGLWERSRAGDPDRLAQTSTEIRGAGSIVADHARAGLTEIELNPGIDTRLYPSTGERPIAGRKRRNAAITEARGDVHRQKASEKTRKDTKDPGRESQQLQSRLRHRYLCRVAPPNSRVPGTRHRTAVRVTRRRAWWVKCPPFDN